jgi:uncharacterized membrane protein
MPSLSRIVLGAFFLAAGALHFLKPRPCEAIMPEALPAHRELVYFGRQTSMMSRIEMIPASSPFSITTR